MKLPSIIIFLAGMLLFSCQSNSDEDFPSFSVYPNPLVNVTTLTIDLPETSEVEIYLYDVRNSAQLGSGPMGDPENPIYHEVTPAGSFSVQLDFSEKEPGFYFMDLVIDKVAKRVRLLKSE